MSGKGGMHVLSEFWPIYIQVLPVAFFQSTKQVHIDPGQMAHLDERSGGLGLPKQGLFKWPYLF